MLFVFCFLLDCQNIGQEGQGCQASAWTFGIVCKRKVNWLTLVVQEMQKNKKKPKESQTAIFAGALVALLAMLFWSLTILKYGLSDSIQTTLVVLL